MKKLGIVMTILLIFWDILQGSISVENLLVGMFVCLFVYKFNKENFITK
ncbi:hypothetical protein [Tepidibacter hydrothermalis]|uniref:Uncharacterized protein n=1 Tax=Tepidibacter hydrothermalis TaxID=3036126 RepID=A0ABY8E8X2_9FIRM|nr:hypothetical protein [Tepidibacter hydrothermalis]WFD09324.1 hypothetical protein P4S50_13120 [Tepidibacter hydrothermalis]